MLEVRKEFPVLSHTVYANTAAFGLMNEKLQEWRQEHDLDYLVGGSAMKMESMELLSETRNEVGDFFGCHRHRVALLPNFSLGLNAVAEGLDKSHHVLLLKGDYPSLNWPFESRGFKISYADIDENLEDNITDKIKGGGVSVLAISLVQWLSGIRIDLEWLKGLKQTFPQLIIIADGTQFCGSTEFRFRDSGIDILGASGYKWLLAGTGNGFMLFDEGVSDRINVKQTGFNSANADPGGREGIRFAKYFEPGHLDSLCFGSLNFALKKLKQIGMDRISAHNRQLGKLAKAHFEELGILALPVVRRKWHSNIFNIEGDERIYHHLTRHKVGCSQRGGGIRLSFHCYNADKDINRIVEILKSKD
jgi:selenocysteine lyase/cysteine desulfurase